MEEEEEEEEEEEAEEEETCCVLRVPRPADTVLHRQLPGRGGWCCCWVCGRGVCVICSIASLCSGVVGPV